MLARIGPEPRDLITESSLARPVTSDGAAKPPFSLQQADATPAMGNAHARKLVWFLVPSEDFGTGGVISISYFHAETRMLLSGSDIAVVASTYPNAPILRKYTRFPNSMDIFAFDEVVAYFKSVEHIILHIPEYFCKDFLGQLSPSGRLFLDMIPRLHINVVLQNIDKCKPDDVQPLRTLTDEITCTTAHDRYSTQEQSDRFGMPLHKLSVFMDRYEQRSWTERDDIIILSPDPHPLRDRVIEIVAKGLPKVERIPIINMPYENYRSLIAKAKWSLTFGEGLDGYFAEMAWTGGVAFAVYNNSFFMPEFRGLPTVYDTWENLQASIVDDILKFDHEEAYAAAGEPIRRVLHQFYSPEKYRENIRLFYEERYSFRPTNPLRVEEMRVQAHATIAQMRQNEETRDAEIGKLNDGIEARDVYIPQLKQEIEKRDVYIGQLRNGIEALREAIAARDASIYWKLTAPLRLTADLVRRGIAAPKRLIRSLLR
jgi:hypothetical protein